MDLYKIAASNLKGIGKQRLKQISRRTNGIHALFEHDLNYLVKHFKIKKELLITMNIPQAMSLARKQMDFNEKYGIQTLFMEDDNYPGLLKECCDAPITLFYKGNISLKKKDDIHRGYETGIFIRKTKCGKDNCKSFGKGHHRY